MAIYGEVDTPFQVYKFRVVSEKLGELGFKMVSGLSTGETEAIEYREGQNPHFVRKLPGLTSFDVVTFERGMSRNPAVIGWRNQVINIRGGSLHNTKADSTLATTAGYTEDLEVLLFDNVHTTPVARWILHDSWPSKLESGDLDASSGEVLIETLEITCSAIEQLPLFTGNSIGDQLRRAGFVPEGFGPGNLFQ